MAKDHSHQGNQKVLHQCHSHLRSTSKFSLQFPFFLNETKWIPAPWNLPHQHPATTPPLTQKPEKTNPKPLTAPDTEKTKRTHRKLSQTKDGLVDSIPGKFSRRGIQWGRRRDSERKTRWSDRQTIAKQDYISRRNTFFYLRWIIYVVPYLAHEGNENDKIKWMEWSDGWIKQRKNKWDERMRRDNDRQRQTARKHVLFLSLSHLHTHRQPTNQLNT